MNTVLRNVVNQLVVLPNRLPVQLVPDIDIQRLKYPLPQGVLHINIISGRNLKAGDKNMIGHRTSDPYCVIRGILKYGANTSKTSHKDAARDWPQAVAPCALRPCFEDFCNLGH
ncbi:unnamed protein product [Schistosoma margrebowiei]|uniref:C2 domain-containing protein n=1 Tax=Schistosoma margrebowiei TaxID=48269 RepID=A0A3P8GVT9_9TREM|nr:unnamed protein product [Schistosoma margrebowiei]